ncbi:Serine/threonine-protein kinase PrkC [Planctomycetes bacterium Poly30]|uniref:Serine/threonine-protein kinase PrkC n=1 Tax=Saltatorellus ferox TaxID=2528018 RepID=A0A518ES16_9BACT|nr:Serine/threonine-protein kinase PrkC [Planctomycetes bacterium Poly30]
MTDFHRDTSSSLRDAHELELARLVEAFEEARQLDPSGVTIGSWMARHPQYARELGELLPGLLLMQSLGSESSEAAARRELQEQLPDAIGEFRILRRLGRGGMGIVYLAEQASLRRQVALKVLPSNLELDRGFVERFQREARAAARLLHPHIVPVYGAGQVDGLHYFAMRYVDGSSLEERLRELRCAASSEGARTADSPRKAPRGMGVLESVRIASEVASALAHAHAGGVLHRDIKPGNVLLDGEGCAWVTDFGLCRVEDAGHLTSDGAILGTLRYMAPEQIDGAADERSDVYGVGLLLFELLTLRPAYDSVKRGKVVHDVLHAPLPRLRRLRPDVPRELETIVQKAAAKLPQERYGSAAALHRDLEAFLNHRPIHARPPSTLYLARLFVSRHRLATAVAAVAVCLLGLIGALYVRDLRASQATSQRRAYAGDLAAAEAALREGATRRARFHLDQAPVALRSWEWAHLDARIDQALGSVQLSTGVLDEIALRPDGRMVAVASNEGISLVSLPGLEPKALIRCGVTHGLAWDAEGERLVAALESGHLHLYGPGELSAHDLLRSSRVPQDRRRDPVEVLVVGDRAVVGTNEGNLLEWDLLSGTLTHLDDLASSIIAVEAVRDDVDASATSASTDSTAFWAASIDGDLVEYRGRARSRVFRLKTGSHQIQGVEIDASGKGVLITQEGAVRGFLLPKPGEVSASPVSSASPVATYVIDWLGERLAGLAVNGELAAAVGVDKLLHLVDLQSGGEVRALSGSPHPLTDVDFVAGTRMVLTSGEDGWLRAFDRVVAGGGIALRGHVNDVNSLAFSPDGRRLVTGGRDGVVIVWDLERGEPLEVFTDPVSLVSAVGFVGPAGSESIFAGTEGGHYFLWHPPEDGDPNGQRRPAYGNAGARVQCAAREDRAGALFVATSNGVQRITVDAPRSAGGSAAPGEVTSSLHLAAGEEITGIDFAGDRLVCVTQPGQVLTFDPITGELLGQFDSGFRSLSSQLSMTGERGHERGVFVTVNREVVIFDLATETTRVLFASRAKDGALGELAMAAAWTRGGERVLVTTRNGLLSVWDPLKAEHLVDLRGHEYWAMRVQCCLATGWIVSLSSYAGVRVWNTDRTRDWAERLGRSVPLRSAELRAQAVETVSRAAVLDKIRDQLTRVPGKIPGRDWMLVASLYRSRLGDIRAEALYSIARARFDRSSETLARLEACLEDLSNDAQYAPLLQSTIAGLWDVDCWRGAMRARAAAGEVGLRGGPPAPRQAVHRTLLLHAPFVLVTPLWTRVSTLRTWFGARRLSVSTPVSEGLLTGLPAILARFRGR